MHSKDIAEEINRLSALGLVDRSSERRQSIYRRHVADFSSRLRPLVAQALKEEARAVAAQWLDNAESMVGWLLAAGTGNDPEIPSGADGEARLTDAGKAHLIGKISESLQDNSDKVTDEEVEEHAVELAQLLLSNWVGILEQAFADAPGQDGVLLEYKALPPQTDPNALGRGCEAYALAVEDSMKALLAYQDSLVMPGNTVDLSADIQLHRSVDGRWLAFRSGSEVVSADPAAEISAEGGLDTAYHRISCWMADDLVPMVVAMGSSSEIDTETVKRLVKIAARGVVNNDLRKQPKDPISRDKKYDHALQLKRRAMDLTKEGNYNRAVQLKRYAKNSAKDAMSGSSRGDKLARGVGNMMRLHLQGQADAAAYWKSPHSTNWIHSVGRLNSADLCFVALPAMYMAEWMARHQAMLDIEEERPEGDTEKRLVKYATRIAENIRSENPGILSERVWAQFSES